MQNRARNAGHTDPLSQGVRAVVSPGSQAIDDLTRYTSGQWSALSEGQALQREVARLREVERAASLYSQTVDGLRRELDQLRKLVHAPNYGRERILGRIIGSFPLANRVTLSVGSRQGVGTGMAVVTGDGLLGIVQNLAPESCQVRLTCSPDLKFGAMVQRIPEVTGLMKGQTPTRLVLDVLDSGLVEVGDPVVTSGLSERIPRGIPVGTVAEVVPDPSYGTRRVFVAPAAQVGPSVEVAVLK